MNVLSLFDGISCGQIALGRVGINVDNYFALEIDKHAIEITQTNYPNTIQLGDVTKINYKNGKLYKEESDRVVCFHSERIDLIIGGSPCQGFSFAGKQLNFEDLRSKLFFEFVRLLKECKPKHFLLENVKMQKKYQDIITSYVGCEPIALNSMLLSKQNRPRLYWTNIPIAPIESKNCNFNGYLYRLGHGYIRDEIKFFKKYPSLTAQSPATKYRIVTDVENAKKALFDGDLNKLRRDTTLTRSATPEECEEFQTLPVDYTKNLNKTQRYKVIGNGWTVDVIAHIFKGLLNENL